MPVLKENQQFERYRITRWLGNGLSGVSYEATDTLLQRKVTLKLIHPWAMLPESARRQFYREMQDISLLNHAYLAPILDYGEIDGSLYIVRRYVSSGSLLSNEGRLWFKPPFEVADAIRYGYQLAQALDYIHQHGYLHGGFTFTNILVLRGANIDHEPGYAPFLLADIGLANFVRRFGQPLIPLLPITAAPEQSGKSVTPASDQFSLAVLLYFWLAGRPPYLGAPDEVEHLKLTESFPPLSSLNSQVTLEQETVLRRALRVYPDERYPSVLAFAEALLTTLTPPSHAAVSVPDYASQFEPISQLEPIPQTDPALFPEVKQITPLESEAASEFDLISESEPSSQDEERPILEFEQVPHTDPTFTFEEALELLHQPDPEPLPAPVSLPDSLPQPDPEPLPTSALEPLPQPAPDIFQALPDAEPVPDPLPQPETTEAEAPAELEAFPQQEAEETEAAQPSATPRLLISLRGNGEPYEFLLEREETLLGHAGSDDVLLDQDAATSRHHALLKHEENRYVIYDQSSTNGVFVNDQKLANSTGCILSDGDHITIGNYELIFCSRLKVLS
jgi:serine/threonine protein kinase